MLKLLSVERRYAKEDRRSQLLNDFERHVWTDPSIAQNTGAAEPQRKGQSIAETIGVEKFGNSKKAVVLAETSCFSGKTLAGINHVLVAMDNAFRVAR